MRHWRHDGGDGGMPIIPVAALMVVTGVLAGCIAQPVQEHGRALPGPVVADGEIVDPVVSDARDDARFAVGLDGTGALCAEVGTAIMTQRACGGDQLTAMAYQTQGAIVLAGYLPMPVGALTAILDGEHRRPLVLTPFADGGMLAFGSILRASPTFIEIEVVDENGAVIMRHFPTIAP